MEIMRGWRDFGQFHGQIAAGLSIGKKNAAIVRAYNSSDAPETCSTSRNDPTSNFTSGSIYTLSHSSGRLCSASR